ncbi:unnamed protein product [Echinostoma caproni]|uniref:DDHD domain-containing protein n=1 Tax=Echinostoma caproni TaxID=27848 RepID=A0A3P8FTH1_9TREM|nr:unnamed protein product [Echinostoma caproni]
MVAASNAIADDTPEGSTEPDPGDEHSVSVRENMTPSFQLMSDELSDDLDYSGTADTQKYNQPLNQIVDDTPFATTSLLQLEHRIDFQLRASRYENMYISFLTSHTSYWTNADVGMLIMTQLFGVTHPPK